MELDIQPVVDMVLVEPLETSEKRKTVSGLQLPQTGQPQLREGKVISIGSGAYTSGGVRMEPDIKIGDTVLYTGVMPYFEHFIGSVLYHFVRVSAILAYRPSSRGGV